MITIFFRGKNTLYTYTGTYVRGETAGHNQITILLSIRGDHLHCWNGPAKMFIDSHNICRFSAPERLYARYFIVRYTYIVYLHSRISACKKYRHILVFHFEITPPPRQHHHLPLNCGLRTNGARDRPTSSVPL